MRAIRQLLPANQYDIGHEAALWQQPAVQQVHEQWGWQAAERIERLTEFGKLMADLPVATQTKLVTLLAQYHAQLPEELYFEMLAAFLQTDALWQLIPTEVQQATQVFMANLVKTYDRNPGHQGLDLFVQRYLARHAATQCRQMNQYAETFYILDKIRHHSDPDWPEDITAKQIQAFSNVKQAATPYLLIQQGQQLQLIADDLYQQQGSSDWGNTGVILAKLSLTDTVIHYQQQHKDGSTQEAHLTLSAAHAVDLGELHAVQALQIGEHTFTFEVAAPLEAIPWIVSWAMSAELGHYVASKDKQGHVYRWYWHAPEWHKEAGVLRGVWYFAKPTQITTPDWAASSGRDQYGIYADINIQGVPLRMRWIEPGTFLMGSPENEAERDDDEDQHQVTLTQGYWLADSAVTQALWGAIMAENPSHFKGNNLPVEQVSWDDIQIFITQLNALQPLLNLCLPSEAQWEYACRAGTTTPFYFGDNISPEQVNYDGTRPYAKGEQGEYREKTVPVKSLAANAWGLYEMHGNVWEWCQDTWQTHLATESVLDPLVEDSSDFRVVRGGSWDSCGGVVRSAVRSPDSPAYRDGDAGFRLARGHPVPVNKKIQSIPASSLDRRVPEQRQSKLLAGIGKLLGRK